MSRDEIELVWTDPKFFLAFGFGSGLSPIAPGTCGTIAAIAVYYLLSDLSALSYLLLVVLLTVLGIILCDKVSLQLGVHDHPGIVIDEIVGYLITMLLSPPGWAWVLLGFFLFRLFDIWKPWIISMVDKRVHGGVGIMLDDILAGIAAMIVMQFIVWLFV